MSTVTDLKTFRAVHGDPSGWTSSEFDEYLNICDARQADARAAAADSGRLSPEAAERLDRLFRLYSRRVLAYAVTRAKRPEDAHDIAGEVWAKACRSITGLRADDDHAMPWLASAVRTVAIDFYRPKRASEQLRDWTDAMASRPLPVAPPADQEGDLLALAELTVPEARVFKLAAQGLSQSAIGARLGRHKGTVSRQLYSGARRLRVSMEDKQPLPVRKPGATNPPKPRAAHSRASVALAG